MSARVFTRNEFAGSVTLLVVFLIGWQWGPELFGIPPYIVPPLTDVVREFFTMLETERLLYHCGMTAMAVVVGFVLGSVLAGWTAGFGSVARTTAIEVGMQNSGLGAVLAQAHFANPLTAIPSAISAITHCIIGSGLAGLNYALKQADIQAVLPTTDEVEQFMTLCYRIKAGYQGERVARDMAKLAEALVARGVLGAGS